MPGCSHHHPHNMHNIKADHFTNAETIGETLESAASNFLWGTSIARTFSDDSATTLLVGSAFTLLAPGSIYAHRKLSKYHQHLSSIPTSSTETLETPLHSHDHAHDHAHHSHTHLTKWQKFLVAMDYLSHIGDRSGAILGIASWFLDDYLSPVAMGSLQIGTTLFGAYTTWASVRNCKNAIASQNPHENCEDEEKEHYQNNDIESQLSIASNTFDTLDKINKSP